MSSEFNRAVQMSNRVTTPIIAGLPFGLGLALCTAALLASLTGGFNWRCAVLVAIGLPTLVAGSHFYRQILNWNSREPSRFFWLSALPLFLVVGWQLIRSLFH